MEPLDFTPLEDLVTLMRAQDLRADTDPDKVQTPGVWVALEQVNHEGLGLSPVLSCAVYFVTGEKDHRRAMASLADLFNAAVPSCFTPDGPAVPQGLILPRNPNPLPALRVPVDL